MTSDVYEIGSTNRLIDDAASHVSKAPGYVQICKQSLGGGADPARMTDFDHHPPRGIGHDPLRELEEIIQQTMIRTQARG